MRTIIELRRATASLRCSDRAGLAHGETVPFPRPRKLTSIAPCAQCHLPQRAAPAPALRRRTLAPSPRLSPPRTRLSPQHAWTKRHISRQNETRTGDKQGKTGDKRARVRPCGTAMQASGPPPGRHPAHQSGNPPGHSMINLSQAALRPDRVRGARTPLAFRGWGAPTPSRCRPGGRARGLIAGTSYRFGPGTRPAV